MVDLLAICLFNLTTGVDLRAVKVLRALRIISLLKLTRYNAAMARFARAFALARGIYLVCYCDNDDLVLGGSGYLLL